MSIRNTLGTHLKHRIQSSTRVPLALGLDLCTLATMQSDISH